MACTAAGRYRVGALTPDPIRSIFPHRCAYRGGLPLKGHITRRLALGILGVALDNHGGRDGRYF
jgi:hypothetical protein